MPSLYAVYRASIAGFVSGVVILGFVGRLLMWAVAVALYGSGGFTLGGSIEVLAAGALFGTLGGLVLLFIPEHLNHWRAIIHAAVFFVLIALASGAAQSAVTSIAWPQRIPVLLASCGLVYSYSLFLMYLNRKTPDSSVRDAET